MMMMGLHFTGEVPFRRVFINALVRDAQGAKMSKSKGNVVDPLGLVDKYGADALRFTMTALSGPNRDIKLSEQRIEGYRNFGTKLWNAARFCQMNECVRVEGFDPATLTQTINKWIRGETAKTAAEVTRAIEACAFDDAAGALYRFIWNVFCDWYLELAKPILNGDDEAARAETRATAAWVLDECLKLLHPVMPFITEELWDKTAEFGAKRDGFLMTAAWPELPASYIDAEAMAEVEQIIELVTEVRSIRAELRVPPSARTPLTILDTRNGWGLYHYEELIRSLARLSTLRLVQSFSDMPPAGVPVITSDVTGSLAIAEFIDLAAEKARLVKDIATAASDIDRTAKKLGNADFVSRAPEEVVEENRERLAEAQAAKAKLEAALARLETVA
jgi:valyl-tRNA synthetase